MFVPILAYHKIQNNFDLSLNHITPGQFEKQIKYLYLNGFTTISISEYIKNKSFDDKKVIITFDDGYVSVFEHALPILSKYKFTATIFVISKYVGDWNKWDYNSSKFKTWHCNWEQLKILTSAGWEIGSHTMTHQNLKGLTKHQILCELKKSKNLIEKKLQKPVNIISYPYGIFDQHIIECVKMVGYQGGCTLGQNYPQNEIFPYALFRRGVYKLEPFKLFKLKLKNERWSHFDDIKQKIITYCSHGSILLRHVKSH